MFFIAGSWILSSNSSKFHLWWDSHNLIFGYWMWLVLWRQTTFYSWSFVSDQSKHKMCFALLVRDSHLMEAILRLQPVIFSLAFQNSAVWVEASLESLLTFFPLQFQFFVRLFLWPDWKAALGTQQSPPLNVKPGFLLGICLCDHHIIDVNHKQKGKENQILCFLFCFSKIFNITLKTIKLIFNLLTFYRNVAYFMMKGIPQKINLDNVAVNFHAILRSTDQSKSQKDTSTNNGVHDMRTLVLHAFFCVLTKQLQQPCSLPSDYALQCHTLVYWRLKTKDQR